MGVTYLHLRHIAAFLLRNALRRLDSHIQVILIGHCDHITVILELHLELVSYAELLAD